MSSRKFRKRSRDSAPNAIPSDWQSTVWRGQKPMGKKFRKGVNGLPVTMRNYNYGQSIPPQPWRGHMGPNNPRALFSSRKRYKARTFGNFRALPSKALNYGAYWKDKYPIREIPAPPPADVIPDAHADSYYWGDMYQPGRGYAPGNDPEELMRFMAMNNGRLPGAPSPGMGPVAMRPAAMVPGPAAMGPGPAGPPGPAPGRPQSPIPPPPPDDDDIPPPPPGDDIDLGPPIRTFNTGRPLPGRYGFFFQQPNPADVPLPDDDDGDLPIRTFTPILDSTGSQGTLPIGSAPTVAPTFDSKRSDLPMLDMPDIKTDAFDNPLPTRQFTADMSDFFQQPLVRNEYGNWEDPLAVRALTREYDNERERRRKASQRALEGVRFMNWSEDRIPEENALMRIEETKSDAMKQARDEKKASLKLELDRMQNLSAQLQKERELALQQAAEAQTRAEKQEANRVAKEAAERKAEADRKAAELERKQTSADKYKEDVKKVYHGIASIAQLAARADYLLETGRRYDASNANSYEASLYRHLLTFHQKRLGKFLAEKEEKEGVQGERKIHKDSKHWLVDEMERTAMLRWPTNGWMYRSQIFGALGPKKFKKLQLAISPLLAEKAFGSDNFVQQVKDSEKAYFSKINELKPDWQADPRLAQAVPRYVMTLIANITNRTELLRAAEGHKTGQVFGAGSMHVNVAYGHGMRSTSISDHPVDRGDKYMLYLGSDLDRRSTQDAGRGGPGFTPPPLPTNTPTFADRVIPGVTPQMFNLKTGDFTPQNPRG